MSLVGCFAWLNAVNATDSKLHKNIEYYIILIYIIKKSERTVSMSRPIDPNRIKKNAYIGVMTTPEIKDAANKLANKQGRTLSNWVEQLINREVQNNG